MDSLLSRWRPRSRTTVDGCRVDDPTRNEQSRLFSLARFCLRSEPDSLSFVGVQLQATWFSPLSVDIICAAWQTCAQLESGFCQVDNYHGTECHRHRSVTARHVDPAVKQCLPCTTQNSVDPEPSFEVHCSRPKNCTSLVLREWMIESDRLNMTQTSWKWWTPWKAV